MSLSIESVLPLFGLTVTLRFNQKTRLNFFHSTSLAPFVRHLAGSPENFDSLIKIDAPESGRHEYRLGDLYRFSLYGLNGSQDLLIKLIGALQQLPFSAIRDDPNMPFRRNLELEALHDAFSGKPIKQFQQLSPYQLADLKKECEFWQDVPSFRMQLLSPMRVLKDKQTRQSLKGEARYCQQKSDLSADLISNRLYDYFAALLRELGPPRREQPEPLTLDESSHLFWLNIHYTDNDAQSHAMGGMMGEIVLSIDRYGASASRLPHPDPLPEGEGEAWEPDVFDWTLWVLGQYTGFGQRSAFGFGRYRLQKHNLESSFKRATPAASLLASVNTSENLIAALEHIQSNRHDASAGHSSSQAGAWEPGVPDLIPEGEGDLAQADEEAMLERLQNDIAKLLKGRFKPPHLNGFIIEKADKSPRRLAVPPFRDRVLQRAVAQVLQPIVDVLQYQHSYGFRAGRSRIHASYAIQSAWREGYRWVYESDIEDFFDSVNWQRLEVRLRALWNDDPLVGALCSWMKASVDFEGQTIQRTQGLPQGSPLSPMLANIMLDDFDNDMQTAGFKLIRFADDFVVLCKSREQAQLAHQAAELSLQEHGLKLNQDKTHITHMDKGFHYLGYLFLNDMVLESPKSLQMTVEEAVSKHSWLTQVVAREPKAIEAPGKQASPQPAKPTAPVQRYGERDQHGLLLCIAGECALIRTQDERIVIERDEQILYEAPWRHLHAVLLLGRHNITTPALTESMVFNIPLHFASMTGKYQGVVWNGQTGAKGSQLWLKQQQIFSEPQHALRISREIVGARLANSRETLRSRGKPTQPLDGLIAKLDSAQTLAELNGLEGSGARFYFSAFKELLPNEFGFNERNRQPPLDPFNALLSLGFSVLYSCLETILRTDGLLPWQGVYHQPHGKHATLVSDLMEPFRHIVERQALGMIKRREIKLEDFYNAEQNACYIKKEPRNHYLGQLMAKFDSKIAVKSELEGKNIFEHIHQQNLSLIRFIEQGEEFKAWRIR